MMDLWNHYQDVRPSCCGLSFPFSDWPGQLQNVQQHLLVVPVLLSSTRVQLEGFLLEERQRLGQRSQLYQVQEVEVAEPLGSLAGRQLRVEALPELGHVVTPLPLEPAIWRRETANMKRDVNQTGTSAPAVCESHHPGDTWHSGGRWC